MKRDQIVIGDALTEQDKVQAAMEGFDGLVILTSAVPKIKLLSLIGVFWGKLTGKPTMPEFYFDQRPEQARLLAAESARGPARAFSDSCGP